jgi:hypothetical protein
MGTSAMLKGVGIAIGLLIVAVLYLTWILGSLILLGAGYVVAGLLLLFVGAAIQVVLRD